MPILHDCTALITGASSGLGAEMARQLAPIAKVLILAARRNDRLEALKTELSRDGLEIFCYQIDLNESGKIDALADWLIAQNIQVDFLVNNAGLGDHGPFQTSDWNKTEMILRTNIIALTKLTHTLLPMLHRAPRAAILNVSSVAGFFPVPDLAVYAASKAYVNSFSEALGAELHETEISVTTVCPGPASTEFGSVAERNGRRIPAPEFFKTPVEKVVADALQAVSHGRARVIPGLLVATLTLIGALLPMALLRLAWRARGNR